MEDDETKKDGKIECVLRKYNIHLPGGSILEIENIKPINEKDTKRILEEYNKILDFFKHHRIIGYLHPVPSKGKILREREPRPDPANPLTPRQRVNLLLEMKGEFTREDYITYMKGLKYDMTKWMAHIDFNNALELKRLELTDSTKRAYRYKVIDPTSVDESLFEQFLKDKRVQMGVIQ